jgi:hypothetical protein
MRHPTQNNGRRGRLKNRRMHKHATKCTPSTCLGSCCMLLFCNLCLRPLPCIFRVRFFACWSLCSRPDLSGTLHLSVIGHRTPGRSEEGRDRDLVWAFGPRGPQIHTRPRPSLRGSAFGPQGPQKPTLDPDPSPSREAAAQDFQAILAFAITPHQTL